MPSFLGATDLGNNGGSSSSYTASFALPAGGTLLVAAVLGAIGSGDYVTGATYGGSAMTLAAKVQDDVSRFMYFFFLINPPTGTNNLVVTASAAIYIFASAAAYSGFASSGQPDVTNTNTGTTTSVTNTFTTTQPNDWAITMLQANNGAVAAGSGLTLRLSAASGGYGILDSAGSLGSAGSHSVTGISSTTAADNLGQIAVAFVPFAGTPMTADSMMPGEALPSVRKGAPHLIAIGGSMQRDD